MLRESQNCDPTVFLCYDVDDDVEDGIVGFATETLTLGVGTFSFFPSGTSENNFLTSLFCTFLITFI